MPSPFRVASTTDSTSDGPASYGSSSSAKNSSASSTVEPGLYTYAAVTGHPYGVKHFKLKLFYESGNYTGLQEQLENLDQYIKTKAKERGLEDSGKSYEEIVNEILKKIGKSPNEESFNTFQRVNAAVTALQRLKEAKLPENLDLPNLTSKEIEDISE